MRLEVIKLRETVTSDKFFENNKFVEWHLCSKTPVTVMTQKVNNN